MGSIYKITNTVNGKAYIGQTIKDAVKTRIQHHLHGHGNVIFTRALHKYGKAAFQFEILHDGIIPEFLDSYEMEAIAKHKTLSPNGYNLTEGGSGHGKRAFDPDTRHKMSERMRGKNNPMYGKKHTPDTRRRLSKIHTGRKLSPEHRQSCVEAQRRRVASPEYVPPMQGKTHSPEARRKISESNTGKTSALKGVSPSQETRIKISKANSGKKRTLETCRRISEAKKGSNNPMYGRRHPCYHAVYTFFMDLPTDMSLKAKRKCLYDAFPKVREGLIRYWVRKEWT